jgi:hypothetical protein
MRIGDILLAHQWIDWEQLALAVGDQADLAERSGRGGSRIRLCSLLVSRGVLDFDNASRALGEHFSCAAALRRHLEQRDKHVAALLPPHTARRLVVLPIGRLANGALIVCARDPSPALQAALAKALVQEVVIAAAPASYLERLVERTYAADLDLTIDVTEPVSDVYALGEFDIEDAEEELSAFDIALTDDEDDDGGSGIAIEVDAPELDDFAIDVDMPDEKERAKQSRPLPVVIKPVARAATEPPVRDSLDATIASFKDIDDLEWLFDVIMGYVTKRWTNALLLSISDRRAVGVRGHGRRLKPATTTTFTLPLSEPSLVQAARDEGRVVDEAPLDAGRSHASLVDVLDKPLHPVAVPFSNDGRVAFVLVVGDPLEGDNSDAVVDLEVLAEAASIAVTRI